EHRLETERLEEASQQPDRSPEQQQRGSDDDRRDGHGKVDDDAEDSLAAEAVARQDVSRVRPQDRVDRRGRERDDEAEPKRELRLGRGQSGPERLHAALEGEDEDSGQRHQDQGQKHQQDDRHRHDGAPRSRAFHHPRAAHFFSSIFRTRFFQTPSTIVFFAFFQPPKSEMRKGSWISANPALSFHASWTLRNPYFTKILCASSVQRKFTNRSTRARSEGRMLRSMTTSVCSERIVRFGT